MGLAANRTRFLGNFRVNSKADIPEALEALKDRPLYAEKWAHFKMVSPRPSLSL